MRHYLHIYLERHVLISIKILRSIKEISLTTNWNFNDELKGEYVDPNRILF